MTRRGDHRQPLLVVPDSQRLHRRVVVVQRLAHAHEDDVERLIGEAERVREHAHLAGDLAGSQVPDQSHLAGEAERAAHGASDLR